MNMIKGHPMLDVSFCIEKMETSSIRKQGIEYRTNV